MRILLDENLPRKLAAALRTEGHEVESVMTLRMQGLENGALFGFACSAFDLFFTRDAGFAHNVRQSPAPPTLKLIRVIIAQQPQEAFVLEFLVAFRATNWSRWEHGSDWP
ncbi:MAG: hypothetical protein RL514_3207 [Verrucomicrobiota bacterium]